MSGFQSMRVHASRKERCCPECREPIAVGHRYAREIGQWDGDFYSAIMCLPCKVFADRYVESMHLASYLNWDECSYTFGEIINEAAEFVDYRAPREAALSERRAAIMALFGECDLVEQQCQRLERKQRAQQRIDAARRAADAVLALAPASPLTPKNEG